MLRRLVFTLPLALALWAQAGGKPEVVLLWPDGAPGSEGKTGEEEVRSQGDDLVASGIHRPSLTVYLPPKWTGTGAAVIVAPGGSYRELWITHEGYRVGEWLSAHGIAAFVLKYRLPRANGSTYTEATAVADMQRAIRTVRARAAEWDLDPERVGVMGFSAGAHLAGVAAAGQWASATEAADQTDRLSAKPAFQALIYPPSIAATYSAETPEAFLVCGGEDRICDGIPHMYMALRRAGVPAEMHIYAGVGHGFGVRPSNSARVAGWLDSFRAWLADRGLLKWRARVGHLSGGRQREAAASVQPISPLPRAQEPPDRDQLLNRSGFRKLVSRQLALGVDSPVLVEHALRSERGQPVRVRL